MAGKIADALKREFRFGQTLKKNFNFVIFWSDMLWVRVAIFCASSPNHLSTVADLRHGVFSCVAKSRKHETRNGAYNTFARNNKRAN